MNRKHANAFFIVLAVVIVALPYLHVSDTVRTVTALVLLGVAMVVHLTIRKRTPPEERQGDD